MNEAVAAVTRRIRRSMTTARVRLEDVLLGLRELPPGLDRAPVARVVERAIAGVLALADLEVDHDRFFPGVDEVLRAAVEAEEALAPLGGSAAATRARDRLDAVARGLRALREASIDALVAMQDRRLRAAPAAAPAPPALPFRASVGVPAVHAVLRAPPRVLVDLRPPTSFDPIGDAEDVIDEPADEPPLAPLTPEDALLVGHARAFARECLADIGTLANLRAPLPEAPWTNAERFERRMLANLDAVLALAAEPHHLPAAFNVFEEVQRYARDAPTVDPGRELCRALVFAVTRSEHALRAVVLTLKQAHPDTFDAYREALCLARHPATANVMRELLLVDPDPRRAALALDVLAFLREARFADVVPLSAHPVLPVRSSALRALGAVPERAAAAELLVDALTDEEEPAAAVQIVESLLRLGRVDGLVWLRHAIDSGALEKTPEHRLAHLRLLALAGGRDDAGRFLHVLEVTPRDAILAGLFGHPMVVAPLLDMLRSANAVRRTIGPWAHPLEIAAAQALERITGAGLRDEAREVSDYDFVNQPAIFVETWMAWWEPRAAELGGKGKLRRGAGWTPRAAVEELAAPNAAEIRADLALEAALTERDRGFEPTDWVARQRAVLAESLEGMGASPFPPGTYPEAWLGRG